MSELLPLKVPVDGPLNTAEPASSRAPGTLVQAVDTAHRHIGPRAGTGRALAGTTTAVPITSQLRSCYAFNGVDTTLTYPYHVYQMTLGLDFSVDLLFSFSAIASGDTTIFCHNGDGVNAGVVVSVLGSGAAAGDQRKVKAILRSSGGTSVTLTGTTQLAAGAGGSDPTKIHHVRVTRSKATCNLYVDPTGTSPGAEATSTSFHATQDILLSSSGSITLGANGISAANTYWTGYIFRAALVSGVSTDFTSARHDWIHTRTKHILFHADGGIVPVDFNPYFSATCADEQSRFHNYGVVGGTGTNDSIGANTATTPVPLMIPVNGMGYYTDRDNRTWNVVVTRGVVYHQRAY